MKNIKKYVNILFIILLIILVVFLFKRFSIFLDLLGIVLVSFIISYSLRPYYKALLRKKIKPKLAAAIVILSILAFILGIIFILLPVMFKEGINLNQFIDTIDMYIYKIKETNLNFLQNEYISNFLGLFYDKLEIFIQSSLQRALEKIVSTGQNILLFFISPTLIYFFLCDDFLILNGIFKLLPCSSRQIVRNALVHIDKVLERYIITQFELCFIIGILTFVTLIFLNVQFPLLLSIINAIFNIIPYFGPIIGAVPIILLSSIQSFKNVIFVAIALLVIQQIEGDIISPKVIGDNVNAHPVTILILLLIGGNIGGILGMIIIVPIWVILKVIYEDLEAYLF